LKEQRQSIAVYEWASGEDEPLVTGDVPLQELDDVMRHITVDPSDYTRILTTGHQRVLFWSVIEEGAASDADVSTQTMTLGQTDRMEQQIHRRLSFETDRMEQQIHRRLSFEAPPLVRDSAPPLVRDSVRNSIGHLTVSSFLPGTGQAVSGTVDGDVMLWAQDDPYLDMAGGEGKARMTSTKVLRLHTKGVSQTPVKDQAITLFKTR
ncbi:hypothetical protein KIPB_011250, partial [Kipferlia bialata]